MIDTSLLRDELARIAARAPSYDVATAAIAIHRRRRGRALAAGSALTLVVTAVVMLSGLGLSAGTDLVAGGADSGPSLPRRLDLPKVWTPDPRDDPAGPASVLYSGSAFPLNDGVLRESNIAVAGARADTYRMLRQEFGPGAGVADLLSPSGDQVAMPSADGARGIEIVDLRTGAVRRLPAIAARGHTPLAWSPDNRTLAVLVSGPEGHTSAGSVWLADTRTGSSRALAGAGAIPWDTPPGSLLSFSADGKVLAVQPGQAVLLMTLDGRQLAARELAPGFRLAGRGALAPDGTHVAIVRMGPCCASATPDATAIRVLELAGSQPPIMLPAVAGASTVRVLGWAPDGDPVAAAFYPVPRNEQFPPSDNAQLVNVRRVAVVAVHRVGDPVVVLAPPQGVEEIDVAADVIAGGRMRPGAGAPLWPVAGAWLGIGTALATIAVTLPVLGVLFVRRRRAARFGR